MPTREYTKGAPIVLKILQEQQGPKVRRKILIDVGLEVISDVAEYGDSGPWNFPGWRGPSGTGPERWYVRGTGSKTPTTTYATSERFSSRWPDMPRFVNTFKTRIDNNTSYGGYLIGDAQVGWASARNWVLIRDALLKNGRKYREMARREVARVNKGGSGRR